MLEVDKLVLGVRNPIDPEVIQRIRFAIRTGLNQDDQPEASVNIRREEAKNVTVSVRFEINDGPLLQVWQVNFVGTPQLSPKILGGQMRNTPPWKPLPSWRGENARTPGAL